MMTVPEEYIVVRGGLAPLPESGTLFSGSTGLTLTEAASGVPHGTIRVTTVEAIFAGGGSVELVPEAMYPGGPLNQRHVNIREGTAPSPFSEPFPNPVPKSQRVPSKPPQ